MTDYTLYYAPGSAIFAVHWLLLDAQIPHQLERVNLQAGEQKTAAYLALNPNGVVPTLLIDKRPVYECAALLQLLALRHPGAGLLPEQSTHNEALYYQWFFHLANSVQPWFRSWFYPAEPAGESAVEAVKENARVRIESAWDRLNTHLEKYGPYICGNTITAVDFLATMLMRWSRNMPRPVTDWPTLAAYASRIKSRPGWKRLYEVEGLTEWS